MMQIEKGKISSSQLIFLVVAFIQGSTLNTSFAYGVTKHDTWLALLAAFIVTFPMVWINMTILQNFPCKNLVQINDLVFGPYLGKMLTAYYLFFFFSIASANLRFVGDFLLTYIIPQTPLIVVLIMFTIISIWGVRAGIEVLARCSVIFAVTTILLVILTVLLLLKEMKLANFLPLLSLPLKNFIQGTHIISTYAFGETAAFMMVAPYVNRIEQARRSMVLGVIIGAATLLTITVRDIAVLGNTGALMVQPSFEAVRLINIADILTRLEIFIALVLLVNFFIKISVSYYSFVLATAQLIKLRSILPLTLPLGILCIIHGIVVFEFSGEFFYGSTHIWPVFNTPLVFFLPPLTLVTAKVRGLPGKQRG